MDQREDFDASGRWRHRRRLDRRQITGTLMNQSEHEVPILALSVEALIANLVKWYPPRCIKPGETSEAAHRYAGKVELVQELAARVEAEKHGT